MDDGRLFFVKIKAKKVALKLSFNSENGVREPTLRLQNNHWGGLRFGLLVFNESITTFSGRYIVHVIILYSMAGVSSATSCSIYYYCGKSEANVCYNVYNISSNIL